MTIDELIELLEELKDQDYGPGYSGDTEVFIATQPSYPLAHSICSLSTVHERADLIEVPDEEEPGRVRCADPSELEDQRIFLTANDSTYDHPYAPRSCWG